MKSILFTKKPRLKNPILVAAWPGMGDVAVKAAAYLKDKLKAEAFGTMAAGDYFQPSGVWIDNGIVDPPQNPKGDFYFYRNPGRGPDLVIFLSDAQPFVDKGYAYASEIVAAASALKIKMIYTFAAMPLPIEHTQAVNVHVVATGKEILDQFARMDVKAMPTGQISGLNGLILGVGKENGLEGVCLLAEIPLYTIQIENPQASIAVLRILCKKMEIDLDLTDLERHARQIQEEIEHLIDYLKNPPEQEERPIDQSEIDIIKKTLADSSGLPDSARQRIDELFKAAKRDLGRALDLKKELDKWNVYEKYEDNFLDLFKKRPKKNN